MLVHLWSMPLLLPPSQTCCAEGVRGDKEKEMVHCTLDYTKIKALYSICSSFYYMELYTYSELVFYTAKETGATFKDKLVK